MEPAADRDLVVLGVVTRPQGVRGQLRVKLHNPDSEILLTLREAFFQRDGATRLVKFRELPRSHQGDVLLWPVGCDDRDQAEALRGTEVSVTRASLPKLPKGEYYHRDLIGLPVRDVAGAPIGTVLRIDTYPTVDVAIVKTAAGNLEIPIIDPYWIDADIEAGCVTVDHIDHLRELLRAKD